MHRLSWRGRNPGPDLTTRPGPGGGTGGPAIVPGDVAGSLLLVKQTGDQPHYVQLTPAQIEMLEDWIAAGAPEN
jgi:hypothetical protein